ncbi:MAG: Gfo/Idh/MocA family oxidoreductase, partial [Clostridia bacterium]|nr:Gfo/Idh/MocA family oxidoreductase [Clostridia bacterium]
MTKNVCIVGYGSIGPTHAAAIEKTENAKFYAVCDNNPKRIDFCKKQYNVKSFSDFDEMILDTNIDSVHICTPHYLHFEMIKKALKAGKTVVCEKPVTMTRAEFNELLTLEGADRVCVSLQNRFNPCFQKLREIIEKGELGNIKAVKGIVTWYRTPDYYLADKWRGKWATEGGGVIINQAIHLLDYLCLIGGKPEAVAANIMNFDLPEIEVEDSCAAHISFKNGVK